MAYGDLRVTQVGCDPDFGVLRTLCKEEINKGMTVSRAVGRGEDASQSRAERTR